MEQPPMTVPAHMRVFGGRIGVRTTYKIRKNVAPDPEPEVDPEEEVQELVRKTNSFVEFCNELNGSVTTKKVEWLTSDVRLPYPPPTCTQCQGKTQSIEGLNGQYKCDDCGNTIVKRNG